MKNFLKISLICLCLLVSSNVLKAQLGGVLSVDNGITMSIVDEIESDDYVQVYIQVQTDDVVSSILVGDGFCPNSNACSGRYIISRECDRQKVYLRCTVTEMPGDEAIEDGCIVIVGPKDCD